MEYTMKIFFAFVLSAIFAPVRAVILAAVAIGMIFSAGVAMAGNGPGEILKDLTPTVEVERPATKQGLGCTNIPIISLFDEQPDGTNCPPTSLERAMGGVLAIGVLAVGAHAATGGTFPIPLP
jgi:hypothetical protein